MAVTLYIIETVSFFYDSQPPTAVAECITEADPKLPTFQKRAPRLARLVMMCHALAS
jgi:hypothetical protein